MGRRATLAEIMAVPPPPQYAKSSLPSSDEETPVPHRATLAEIMAVPPPPRQPPSMEDEDEDVYAQNALKHGSPEYNQESQKSLQAFKAGASENLADFSRLLSKVGFSAILTQKARGMADKQNEKYEDMDPNLHQNLAKAVAEYGMAAMESAAAISGAGAIAGLLGGAAESMGVLAQLAAKFPQAAQWGKGVVQGAKGIMNKNAATRFGTHVAKAIPEGATFGALTTDKDEDLSTGAMTGALAVPAGVGIGMLISKIAGHISTATAKKELARQATKPIEEMEQVLKDNPDNNAPIMLGDAIGSPATKKLELNELPERASYGLNAIEKLDKIAANITKQANDLGEQLGINPKDSMHGLSVQLAEKIKSHADKVNLRKRNLFKESDEAAKDADFKLELANLRKAARENKNDLEKVFEETGIGGPADKSLSILSNILNKTNAKIRKRAQQDKLDEINDAAEQAFTYLYNSAEELANKLAEVRAAQFNVHDAKEKWADAEEAIPKDMYGNKGASKKLEDAIKNHDAAVKNFEDKKKEYQDLLDKKNPEMQEVRGHLENIINLGNKELKKLILMPNIHKVDLKTADLAKHYLNLKYADADAANNSDLKRIYSILLKGINEDIDSAIEGAPEAVKKAHDKAMSFYKKKVVPLFAPELHKVIQGDTNPEQIMSKFLPMTKGSRYYVTQLNKLIDHIPGSGKLVLKQALSESLDDTKRGVRYINPTALQRQLNTIGPERLEPLLEKAGVKSPDKAMQEIKRFNNNMENGEGVFERMANPPTGQRNLSPIMKGIFFQYMGDIFDHIGNRDLTGLLARLAYSGRKYNQFRAINDSRRTLEDIIKLKKGLKIKTTLYHKLTQVPDKVGKPAGLFATAVLNNEDDD